MLAFHSAPKGRVSLAKFFVDARAFGSGWLRYGIINNKSEVADLTLLGSIGSMLAVFLHPVGRDNDAEGIIDDSHLQVPIAVSGG